MSTDFSRALPSHDGSDTPLNSAADDVAQACAALVTAHDEADPVLALAIHPLIAQARALLDAINAVTAAVEAAKE